jgi:hypothetical protein
MSGEQLIWRKNRMDEETSNVLAFGVSLKRHANSPLTLFARKGSFGHLRVTVLASGAGDAVFRKRPPN